VYKLFNEAAKRIKPISLSWRFALQSLMREPYAVIFQTLAFSITLTAMALTFSLRNELLDNWQKQMPAQSPNHFALNIFPDQLTSFQNDLNQAHIASSRFYPVARGRLAAINGQPIQQRATKDSAEQEAAQRELSLTTAEELPEDNQITAGAAWKTDQPGLLSIEQRLADSLKVQLGDELSFTVASQSFSAKIINIRSVHWDSMRPNFFMILSPGTLDAFPRTYLTSFYLAEQQKAELLQLIKKYPATTVVDVEQIMLQFKTLLQELSQAVNLLLYFALLAGMAVLFAAVSASMDRRLYEAALQRTLGAKQAFIRNVQSIEFLLLGFMSGLIAALASEVIMFALYTRVLLITYQPSPAIWLGLPFLNAVVVLLAGSWRVRKLINSPALPALRSLE
jgi:putative ABC transport system permease protein